MSFSSSRVPKRTSLSDVKRPVLYVAPTPRPSEYYGGVLPEHFPPILPAAPEAPVRQYIVPPLPRHRSGLWFFWVGLFVLIGGFFFVWQGSLLKDRVQTKSVSAVHDLTQAVSALKAKQYVDATDRFRKASQSFDVALSELPPGSGVLSNIVHPIPVLSRFSSGVHALQAGKYLAEAGIPLSTLVRAVALSQESYTQGSKISLLDLMGQAKEPLTQVRASLQHAQDELARVAIDDLPADERERFLSVRTDLPTLLALLDGFESHEALLQELLGGNGPRTYLFLLQNNHELRATGGFIGSYALVDINQGTVRRFFVDGIFNPDGQLKENVVPPKPIQKISAAWSLHDSNWFPDFPLSAEKAIFFYEKTGGPTVDGVVTLTPTVMQKLLVVTGPIALPQYGLTVDADNFIPVVQEQVEVKYDKEFNQPKKILADLSQALLEKVFSLQDQGTSRRIAEALVVGLNEKHILLYVRHPETEKLIDDAGWSGRVLDTPRDYLSVIHSNINGYKTDGVIDESIRHRADIQDDGSIIDTVTIIRTHRGGHTPYEWWNKVNADYLRVYVPRGSTLLSTKGTTWEFPPAPLDYERLGFMTDATVAAEEAGTKIDQKSGVRLSEESGKSVFGAWVYVSPGESVTVEYQYRLPFRLDMATLQSGGVDSYSALFQKQSGSPGSKLVTDVSLPDTYKAIWQTEPNLVPYGRELQRETDLKTDVYQGIVVGR